MNWNLALILSLLLTLAFEAVTVVVRLLSGKSVLQFHAEHRIPMLLRIHHMFWGVPFVLLALLPLATGWRSLLFAFGAALILSDLIHHFVVLPLWKGDTGWHWP